MVFSQDYLPSVYKYSNLNRNLRKIRTFAIIYSRMDRKLLNKELGRISAEQYKTLPESGVVLILDNIRSAHNIGSAFRTSDAFKVDRIFLCGICAAPPSAEIHKSALGAEDSVPWEKVADTLEVIHTLKEDGYTIVAVEQTEKAISLEQFTRKSGEKYALIFGNEVDGVQQSVVNEADFAIEIPQYGSKHSLNVSVSIGVVLWQFRKP